MERYNPWDLEQKWQEIWEREGVFEAEEFRGEKVYVLEMFPYPSGRIHMGHVRNYTIGDAIARLLRMKGYNVLHPMGWDAFGLPAENAAIKEGVHPARWTEENIDHMRKQLRRMGFSYDWRRELATCDPEYYRWNQWIFLKMYERGIAYRKTAPVNWCPHDETVLANEQVVEGRCWRCGTPIVQREVPSWFLKITAYAERLLKDLDKLKGLWPDKVIAQQRNWIGRSEGAVIRFSVGDVPVEVFTTRADTIFGATFLVLAPEHPLALKLAEMGGRIEEFREFAGRVRGRSTRERTTAEEKEGVFLGVYAINPANGREISVWSADYVLYEYGTGAIMAVPAHDQRDWEFARKYGLDVVPVVLPKEGSWDFGSSAYEGEGILVNSDGFDGLESGTAKRKITEWLEEKGLAEFRVTYRLRDWNISRQRYWGTPIPIVYCERCGTVPVPDNRLPVTLPLNVSFTGRGNPLSAVPEFVSTECPACGGPARRETDTMDTFFDSSWYFLRYCDPRNDRTIFDGKRVSYWMPVDIYIGGIEHAVLHLLYARFFQKFLKDIGLVEDDEPFLRLVTQGMVLKRWVSVGRLLEHLGLSEEDEVDLLLERLSRLAEVG